MRNNLILEGLNTAQKSAVIHNGSHLRIIAGAGSGKTKVLTRKIAYLIDEMNINPRSILAVTFTKKATNEMRERVTRIISGETKNINIFNYHSFCNRVLRKEIQYFGYPRDFAILDGNDQKTLLRRIFIKKEILQTAWSKGEQLEFISWHKINFINPDEAIKNAKSDTDKVKGEIYKEYHNELIRTKSLDFDDLLIFTHDLFKKNQEVRNKWVKKFRYIMVDEFQDSSPLQFEIIKFISEESTITIVGDPDQTIYTWRGADVKLILEFEDEYPDSTTISLTQNYRSTKKILEAANNLIRKNKYRIHKELVTNNPTGENIIFNQAFSPESEAKWVVTQINKLKTQKVQLKDIAIFYRANYYARAFENALNDEGINYIIHGGIKFYERREIKDILAYLWVIHNGSELSFRRIVNVPARKIGKVNLAKIMAVVSKYIDKSRDLLQILVSKRSELTLMGKSRTDFVDFIATLYLSRLQINGKYNNEPRKRIHEIISFLLSKLQYYDYIKVSDTDREMKLENIKELISSIKKWEEDNPKRELVDYLSLVTISAELEEGHSSNNVSLMTVHNSKGLQFKNVFIVGLSEGVFPSSRALENDHNNVQLEEERRLFYVGITRAKEKLFFSDSRGYHSIWSEKAKTPSRFLKETGVDISNFTSNDIYKTGMISAEDRGIFPGDVVSHTMYGEGTVLDVVENGSQSLLVVAFKGSLGVKNILKNHKSIEKVG